MSTMRFCLSCNNLLYPRENLKMKKLEYHCKQPNCTYVDRNVTNSCVFVNDLHTDSSTRLEVISSDVNKDPTLQRSTDVNCSNCGGTEAVFFLAESTAKSTSLNLVIVCTSCGFKWLEEPTPEADVDKDAEDKAD